jgi:hypothetical protein
MADDTDQPSQPPHASRSRRRPPTIDLQATEVAADQPPQSTPAEAAPAPEPPPIETPERHAGANESPPSPPQPPRRMASIWSMLGGSAGGAIIALILVFLLWGAPWQRDEIRQQQDARIAALDTAVREFAARKPPLSADPKAVAALAERVAKIEAAANAPQPAPDPAVGDRMVAVEQRLGALADELAALRQRTDAIAAAADAAQRGADAAAANAKRAQTAEARGAADERAIRLALVAEMLKAAVARGDRFRSEFEAAKVLAPDQTALAPLEPFADTGLPTAETLGRQLRALLPAMRRAEAPKPAGDAGFLQRLQASAERLVRIRPVGEQGGDDADAIFGRIEAKLTRSDLAGVLADLKTLPPNVRAPAEDWIRSMEAREAAIAASRRFAATHVGALAGRSD